MDTQREANILATTNKLMERYRAETKYQVPHCSTSDDAIREGERFEEWCKENAPEEFAEINNYEQEMGEDFWGTLCWAFVQFINNELFG